MSQQDTLTERYGGPSHRRRWLIIGGSVVLAAVFLGWLLWAAWLDSDPKVSSQISTFDVRDDHTVTVVMTVHVDHGVHATCTVQALAEDHSVVGQLPFMPNPAQGEQQHLTIRTDRRATAVNSLGCTAPGQSRPH